MLWRTDRARRLLSCVLLLPVLQLVRIAAGVPTLEEGFRNPPEQTKPWVYWYWVSDNISKEGITRDLEAMARVGIGEALIGNVDVNEHSRGPVKVLSEEWWGMVEHAIHEGGRVGVKIGLFNCPGWSQSGGPWIKPEQSMRYLATSETRVKGPARFEGRLAAPREIFQDVAVLAFPAPAHDAETIATRAGQVTCRPRADQVAHLADGRLDTICTFPAKAASAEPFVVDITFAESFTARSLVLHPAPMPFAVDCELQAAQEDGAFKTVRKLRLDRTNPELHVGFLPYGPVSVAFSPETSRHFRLVSTGLSRQGGLAEIELTGAARIESYIEKQLAKMCQTPFPAWETYLWPTQPEPDVPELVVKPEAVIDITTHLETDGTLRWDVPAGEWVVLRVGMTPTGVKNAPASPEATGLEVDKMNRQAVAHHFDAFIGHLLSRMPEAERRAFRRVVADSYEMGSQNWTDGLAEVFRARYGYDPMRFLPVLTGRVVGGTDLSDRFLWDLRRLVADRIGTEYVGGLREQCDKHGLRLWLENYGHWGFPGEFLQYGGQSHDIGGEFWDQGQLGLIELRAASSTGHVYGKPIISAEAFTSGGPHWTMDPWHQKRRGDWACTEGINHFVLHLYIHQPFEDRIPGINAPFGTEFNRHNTWFPHAKPWIEYLQRTHFLLQQGKYVADVAYFIGEDTPKMTGTRRPELPEGYSFDYINAEAIEQRMQVRDGRFVLPDGMSYRLLVLPELTTMRPGVLRKLSELVKDGGAVLGEPPTRSPSLQDYPACDRQVRELAAAMWAGCDGQSVKSTQFGKGRVFRGMGLKAVLDELGVPPDIEGVTLKQFPWIHRAGPDADIYFLACQEDAVTRISPSFRVTGRQPELWDAVTGQMRDLPEFREENGRTVVPLEFAPRQSLFVVFRKPAGSPDRNAKNFPGLVAVDELTGEWEVSFDPRWGGPASTVFEKLVDWTTRSEDGIKYYSGLATYRKTFNLADAISSRPLYLDLGVVKNIARVRLNGKDLGLVWTAPWRVDIAQAVKPKGNVLEIDVINVWANRIIGDSKLPPDQRLTWTVHPHLGPKSPLLPAGLLGPVTLQTVRP
ncbi:MAG TPA: glycosyl hydrolase [Phycisphaerae bacterium]|nr:glycosyl hydrolase [Phycisphaerae bacterium]